MRHTGGMAATTSRLGALIDRYKRAHGIADTELARRIGVTRAGLIKWRTEKLRQLPDLDNLAAIARVTGQPYRQVLSAALFDSGYLTDADTGGPRPYAEVLHDAITVLTEATKLTNQPMRQTSSGEWEPNPDPRAALPIDWAEFVTHALAGAAANAGGTEQILAGRPGSWEAGRIRDALQSTVGINDENLWQYRTDPLVVTLYAEDILDTLQDPALEQYEQAREELERRYQALIDVYAGDRPTINIAELTAEETTEFLAQRQEYQRRSDAGELTADEEAADEAFHGAETLMEQLEAQYRGELQDYCAALTDAVRAELQALCDSVPCIVTVMPERPTDGTAAPAWIPPDEWFDTSPVEKAVAAAIANTVTPSSLAGTPLGRLEAATTGPESAGA